MTAAGDDAAVPAPRRLAGEPARRRAAAVSWWAPGASRPARSSRSLDAGRRRARGRARGRRRGAGLGRRRPARRSPSGAFAPADLDGAWLAVTATDDPGGRTRGVRGRRGAAGSGCNAADDPEQLLVHADVGGPPGRPRGHDRHRRAQPGPRHLAAGAASARSSGRSTRHCSTCCPRPGKSCGPRGVRPKTPIGSRRSIPACSTWSAPGRVDEAKELLRTCLWSSSV